MIKVKPGDIILINNMDKEPQYANKIGVIKYIDDAGQIHGTWGGCALISGVDDFKVFIDTNEVQSIIDNLVDRIGDHFMEDPPGVDWPNYDNFKKNWRK